MSEELKSAVLMGLREACAAQQEPLAILPETMLGTLGVSSLQLIELVFELEVRFRLQVDEELLVQLQTVADLIALFESAPGTLHIQGATS